jgi:hypothetical protein
LKIGTEGEFLIVGGREFHRIGAAASKLRSPEPVQDGVAVVKARQHETIYELFASVNV